MSSDDVRSGWRRGVLARPGPARGCLRRVGEGAGGRPRDPARPGSARGFGSVAGDRVHRRAQGGAAGSAPGVHRPDRVGVQDRPVHLTHAARSRPPSKRSISDAASSAGPPARAWTPTSCSAPWSRRSRRANTTAETSRARPHHSDHGSQYLSIAYTGRLVDEGIEASAGAVGSSLCRRRRPGPGQVPANANSSGATSPGGAATTPGAATARWVNRYNRTRPHLTNDDDLSPTAAEHRYHRNRTTTAAPPATA